MQGIINKLKQRFWTADDGTATVETVIMVPVFLGMLFLIVDASMTFAYHSQVVRAVQDVNRQLSVGRITTETQVVSLLQERLNNVTPNASISAVISGGTITSSVNFPLSDVLTFGSLTKLDAYTLSVSSENYIEF